DEAVEEKLTPLNAALRAFTSARSLPEYRRTLAELATTLTAAEEFAERNRHVETKPARELRETVRSARHIVDHWQTKLKSLRSPEPESRSVPPETRTKSQPPANALVLTRAQALDVPTYRRAKVQAEREGKTV